MNTLDEYIVANLFHMQYSIEKQVGEVVSLIKIIITEWKFQRIHYFLQGMACICLKKITFFRA